MAEKPISSMKGTTLPRVGELESSGLMAKDLTTETTLLVASESYLKSHGNPVIPDDSYNTHITLQYKNTATQTVKVLRDERKMSRKFANKGEKCNGF